MLELFIFRITNLLKLNLININTGTGWWMAALCSTRQSSLPAVTSWLGGGGDDTVEKFHEFELMTNCLAKLFHYGFKSGWNSIYDGNN